MDWQVRTADGKSIKETGTEKLERPPSDKFRKRFKTLGPGESVSREVELTKSVQVFRSSHFRGRNREIIPAAHELIGRFEIPRATRAVSISLEHKRKPDDTGGFLIWFRRHVKEVGIPDGPIQSNLIEVRLQPD
jgi:hypothetical protein